MEPLNVKAQSVRDGGGKRTKEKGICQSGRLPDIVDPLLEQTEPITISDWFQSPLGPFPLVPIPPLPHQLFKSVNVKA